MKVGHSWAVFTQRSAIIHGNTTLRTQKHVNIITDYYLLGKIFRLSDNHIWSNCGRKYTAYFYHIEGKVKKLPLRTVEFIYDFMTRISTFNYCETTLVFKIDHRAWQTHPESVPPTVNHSPSYHPAPWPQPPTTTHYSLVTWPSSTSFFDVV